MKSRKRLHIIVIALCLWLPLQALAGQWLHCVQVDNYLEKTALQLISSSQTQLQQPASCHQHASTDKMTTHQSDKVQSTADTPSAKTCNHCQFTCLWHGVLVLAEFSPHRIQLTQHYSPFQIPSPTEPLLATPQRPPQVLSI
jgi:hypothetical protein